MALNGTRDTVSIASEIRLLEEHIADELSKQGIWPKSKFDQLLTMKSDDINVLTNKIIWGNASGPATTHCGITDENPFGNLVRRFSPTKGYWFANTDDICSHLYTDFDIEGNILKFVYRNGKAQVKMICDRDEALRANCCPDFGNWVIREIAKKYDEYMIQEVLKMNGFDFDSIARKVSAAGGSLEINCGFGEASTVTLTLPADRLGEMMRINEPRPEKPVRKRDVKIKDVRTYNDRVTIVYFDDGTFTKCTVGKDDVFNLYTGIAFCLMKKMLSVNGQDGHKAFNNLMRIAFDRIEENEKAKKAEKQLKRDHRDENQRRAEKNAKKAARKREEQISIITEALNRTKEVNQP